MNHRDNTKKKILLFCLLLFFSLPVNFYLSTILDQLLSGSFSGSSFPPSLFTVENSKQVMLFLTLNAVAALLFVKSIFFHKKQNATPLKQLTPEITTPIPAGENQHGSARWMNQKEKEQYFIGSAGVVIGMEKHHKQEHIYTVCEDVHTLCIGATRSGKSRRVVLETIGVLGQAQESMIVSDPKGELYAYTGEYLKKQGYEVVIIDFKDPKKSTRYNFLQPVIDAVKENDLAKAVEHAWDLTSVLVGKSTGEKIWTNGEASVIASAILSVVYDNKDPCNHIYQNLTNVYYFIAEMTKDIGGKIPMEAYIASLPDAHPAKGLLAISEVAPKRTRASFYTSALTTLRLFTSPLIYHMSKESEFDPADIGTNKTAVFLVLPDERTAYYPLASLIVDQCYVALIKSADTRGGRLHRRVNFILDEFSNFAAIPDFAAKLTVGGGRGIRFALFVQSLSQLNEKYGHDVARIIRGNCEIWIYLQANDLETLEEISKKLGRYTVSTHSAGSSSSKYSSASQSENISLMGRELLTTGEVRTITAPYALILSKHAPAMMNLPDLSSYAFNEAFGMGESDHNRLLRKQRNEARSEREEPFDTIPLWNIWKYYAAKLKRESLHPFPTKSKGEND